ncbi:MAG: hypothetical protein QOE70_793 [Chthoniobacter sp.]|jgi:hypothetical protein|nr:hypothetical protein [Chthoniobacter sp.]
MMPRFYPATALLLSCCAVLLTSCRKPEIRVYTVPKDPPPVAEQTEEAAAPAAERPKPKLDYTVPSGWQETAPSAVSVASFAVKGEGGEATINVTPLPNLRGREAMVVNMYRQQAGQPPFDQAELKDVLKPIEVAGGDGQLLEIAGTSKEKPVTIITAIAHRDGRSWFFRLAGDEGLIKAQKPVFLEFLKSVRITEGPAASETASTEPAEKFHWPVPAGWTPVSAGQMQVAKFTVAEAHGAKAEVTVSIFPSDTGGTLANVNRWRKQLGLPEVDQAGASALVTPLDAALPDAVLVSLTHDARALLGAIVPRGGQWWFYKIIGDTAAVTAAHDAFVAFAKAQP